MNKSDKIIFISSSRPEWKMLPEYQDSAEHQQLHGTSKCQKSKDENSVNREIATLLLNLASRTQNNCNNSNFSNGENFKRDCETEAMDLSTVSIWYLTIENWNDFSMWKQVYA